MESTFQMSRSLVKRQKKWATRTKTGCLTCRSRKVKCDEAKPICKRCVIADIPCQGASYGGTNVYTNVYTNKHHHRNMGTMVVASPSAIAQLNGSIEMRDLLYLAPQMPSYVHNTFVANQANVMKEFVASAGEQVMLYLKFLPCRLGYSPTLDSTVACLASALRDLQLPESCRSLVKTLSLYTKALQDLQSSLNDTENSLSAETLCATQLLGIFECLINGDGHQPLNHLRGTAQLYRVRGPSRFSTEFERALLISHAQLIFTQSGFRGSSCYLEMAEWMDALNSAAGPELNNFHCSELQISRYEFMIPFGRLVKVCNRLISSSVSSTIVEDVRISILREISFMRSIIDAWYHRWHAVLELSSDIQDASSLGWGDSREARACSAFPARIFTILYQRLHIAVGGDGAAELEDTTKPLAIEVEQASHHRRELTPEFGPIFAGIVTRAFLTTTDDWQLDIKNSPRRFIRQDLWSRWLGRCGIYPETTDEEASCTPGRTLNRQLDEFDKI